MNIQYFFFTQFPKSSAPKFSISEIFKLFLIEINTIFFFYLILKNNKFFFKSLFFNKSFMYKNSLLDIFFLRPLILNLSFVNKIRLD